MFSLSGFGTLGVVHSSEENADFASTVLVPKGAGHSRQWSPEVDSRVGAQLIANVTSHLSATVQLISEQNDEGRYTPHVEWANLRYEFAPGFSVRVGRTALPSFLVSDFRKVGYANPWVRPPSEVYGMLPIFSSDGADASYRLDAGGFTHTLQAGYGRTEVNGPHAHDSHGRSQWLFVDTIERGPLTLRAAFLNVRLEFHDLDPLFAGLRQFGPEGQALADRFDPHSRTATFASVGGTYDPGNWFVTSEWGAAKTGSALGDRSGWYVGAGYRFGTLTPYALYAKAKADSRTSDPGLDLAQLPPQLAAAAAGLNAGLNAVLVQIPVQHSVSVGARWDFHRNVALKLQYDHDRLGAGSAGVLTNLQPEFRTGGIVNLVSATLDFVW
jgi:predicted porin